MAERNPARGCWRDAAELIGGKLTALIQNELSAAAEETRCLRQEVKSLCKALEEENKAREALERRLEANGAHNFSMAMVAIKAAEKKLAALEGAAVANKRSLQDQLQQQLRAVEERIASVEKEQLQKVTITAQAQLQRELQADLAKLKGAMPSVNPLQSEISALRAEISRVGVPKGAIIALMPSTPKPAGYDDVARGSRLMGETIQTVSVSPSNKMEWLHPELRRREVSNAVPYECYYRS